MKVLHITPHLGGGVGKAHASLNGALPDGVEQTFLLLEEAGDRRYADTIRANGGRVLTATSLGDVEDLAQQADIVQFEFWNHPRLMECLGRCDFPATRSVFWSHTSGLFKPVIQPGLISEAGRFVFSSVVSLASPSLAALPEAARQGIAVVNSGFGFESPLTVARPQSPSPTIAYLGTVDFVKMHPGFFDAIDGLDRDDVRVSIWGRVDPGGAVTARVQAMRHPHRVHLAGHTADPAAALSKSDIFFYPLRPDHYGTGENALIEAMSLGLTPVVLNNPTEMAIVRHRQTGFVCSSIDDCVPTLQMLFASPETLGRVGANAAGQIATSHTPARAAHEFMAIWADLLDEPARLHDFRGVVGDTPLDWFLATQCLPGESLRLSDSAVAESLSKGTLASFANAFPDSELGLRQGQTGSSQGAL
jgi:glycosyltransferase involved in cell wall biosynthesis